jgi:hypothetical protein
MMKLSDMSLSDLAGSVSRAAWCQMLVDPADPAVPDGWTTANWAPALQVIDQVDSAQQINVARKAY